MGWPSHGPDATKVRNARGEAMTRAGFEYVLDKHVRAAAERCTSLKERSVSPHQLRHSSALMLL